MTSRVWLTTTSRPAASGMRSTSGIDRRLTVRLSRVNWRLAVRFGGINWGFAVRLGGIDRGLAVPCWVDRRLAPARGRRRQMRRGRPGGVGIATSREDWYAVRGTA